VVTEQEEEVLETQRDADPAPSLAAATATGPTEEAAERLQPWILHLHDLPSLLQSMVHPPVGSTAAFVLFSHLSTVREKRGLSSNTLSSGEALLQTALVQVRLTPCGRGCPGDLASIYSVSPEEGKQWRTALSRTAVEKLTQDQEGDELEHLASLIPEEETRVGYVTTGNFSLQRGRGNALGAVALSKLLQIVREEDEETVGAFRWLVKFRERTGGVCWAATLELVV